jgi:hypothetical protein
MTVECFNGTVVLLCVGEFGLVTQE